ncbi:alpha/beta-hydrolase [Meira miltonrushii]|uniref:Prolyl endopeptidase n=1 Tax=Meira miltonrushii TaxID=1280837 RepID=A0A316V6K1_9BASI|nr:alpha/beta-hydrolase [Meira miltonrushii]PWN33217.1 alpha/beta-hydrolase [Meira miltonrushii]
MTKLFWLTLSLVTFSFVRGDESNECCSRQFNLKDPSYPSVRRANTTFTYASKAANGNVTVQDPYNWLEQNVSTTAEIQAFLKQQTQLTQTYIDNCGELQYHKNTIESKFDYISYAALVESGPREDPTYIYNIIGQNDQKPIWYIANQSEMDDGVKNKFRQPPGLKYFNESMLPGNGAQGVQQMVVRKDKQIVAYTVSQTGSDLTNLYFRNVSSPYVQPPAKPSDNINGGYGRSPEYYTDSGSYTFAFSPDNQGAFFDQIDKGNNTDSPASYVRIRYHKFGTDPKEDITVVDVDQQNPDTVWTVNISQDEKWLIVIGFIGINGRMRMYMAPLDQPISNKMKWISIVPDYKFQTVYTTNLNNTFYILTDRDSVSGVKVSKFTVDPSKARTVDNLHQLTDEAVMTDVIPQRENATLVSAMQFDDTILVIGYVEKGRSILYAYDVAIGKEIQQVLPDFMGEIQDSRSNILHPRQAFLTVSTFTSGTEIYQITKAKDGSSIEANLWVDSKPASLDASSFKTEQRFVNSTDGAQVSFFMLHKTDFPFDGSRPAWIYFYGSYGTAILPRYDPFLLSWVELFGGVLVFVQARGGGEFGDSWHVAGTRSQKQYTFDDIIAVAEYLVSNKIAKSGKLIGDGRSAGGLAAMAVANQAPENLFGAMIPERGPYDMLRYTQFRAGAFQIPEWGNPADPAAFDWLRAYSPLQNVNSSRMYPMTILSVAAGDDRVPPLHSFKMISELQYSRPK